MTNYYIPDFDDYYVTPEMRSGRLKTPRWTKIPARVTSESDIIAKGHPDGPIHMLIWMRIQQWVIREFARNGHLVTKTGRPLTPAEIAIAVGCEPWAAHMETALSRFEDVGWISSGVLQEDSRSFAGVSTEKLRRGSNESKSKSKSESSVEGGCGGKPSTAVDSSERYVTAEVADRAWAVVPKRNRIGKVALGNEIALALRDHPDAGDLIVSAMERYYRSPQGRGSFAKQPANWVRDGRWQDDPEAWNQNTGDDDIPEGMQRIDGEDGPYLIRKGRSSTPEERIRMTDAKLVEWYRTAPAADVEADPAQLGPETIAIIRGSSP